MLKRFVWFVMVGALLGGLVACQTGTATPSPVPTGTVAVATMTAVPATVPATATSTIEPAASATVTSVVTPAAGGTKPAPTPTVPWQIPELRTSDWIRGGANAGMILVEYSDFQCPACSGFFGLLKHLEEVYPDDLQVVFRHFPLVSIHDKAMISAEAAEAAGAQGQFWEMHDLLFSGQADWQGLSTDAAIDVFVSYARGLDLDIDRFTNDLKEHTYQAKVQQSYDEAAALGLPGTPTLFLNGQYYDGPRSEFVLGGLIQLFNYDGPQYDAPPPMTIDPTKPYFANVETNKGSFCIELYADKAPLTVNNFVFLAQEGFYDGVPFHRVLAGFVAQTGDPTGTGFGGPGYRFEDELDTGLLHDGPGVVSMANAGANTNGSQFFITYQALPDLDGKHTVFGRVVEGMDVVESLQPRDPQADPYAPADVMQKVTISSACQ
jgi:cyclophilin family peptidyl-prolyl cis-trans isomerase/protein-disulfide isomerase